GSLPPPPPCPGDHWDGVSGTKQNLFGRLETSTRKDRESRYRERRWRDRPSWTAVRESGFRAGIVAGPRSKARRAPQPTQRRRDTLFSRLLGRCEAATPLPCGEPRPPRYRAISILLGRADAPLGCIQSCFLLRDWRAGSSSCARRAERA